MPERPGLPVGQIGKIHFQNFARDPGTSKVVDHYLPGAVLIKRTAASAGNRIGWPDGDEGDKGYIAICWDTTVGVEEIAPDNMESAAGVKGGDGEEAER